MTNKRTIYVSLETSTSDMESKYNELETSEQLMHNSLRTYTKKKTYIKRNDMKHDPECLLSIALSKQNKKIRW